MYYTYIHIKSILSTKKNDFILPFSTFYLISEISIVFLYCISFAFNSIKLKQLPDSIKLRIKCFFALLFTIGAHMVNAIAKRIKKMNSKKSE